MSEAHWKPICVSVVPRILCYSCFSDVKAHFSDVEVFFSDVNANFSDVNLEKSDWDLSEEWKTGFLTSTTVYLARDWLEWLSLRTVWIKVSTKEAEIASLADYLCNESVISLVNQMNLTLHVQVFRERRTNPSRRMIWKKKVGRVTQSQAQLFIL